MTAYVALLRAVNVGGTGKLPMKELKRIAEELGLGSPRTFIASGNLVFTSDESESEVRERLERRLADHMGKPVAVMVRTAAEMAGVAKANPFTDAPGRRYSQPSLPRPRQRARWTKPAATTASGWRSARAKSTSTIAAHCSAARSCGFRRPRRAPRAT